ncbi:MAG: NeuD/PglB/VioB family sugar acetyltransferase [Candidatus Aureabacteria bacterium]|nr:NeuD/PglB/VioB family sugar acetyltransferase [Candidatus Auribacterota bacterium]
MMKKKKAIIIGGGGHARVISELLRLLDVHEVLGYIDNEDKKIAALPYLGNDSSLTDTYRPEDVFLINGIASADNVSLHFSVYEKFYKKGYAFETLFHPSSVVSESSVCGKGSQVLARAVINTNAAIGNNVIINTGAIIEHDCVIGAHSHVSSGSVISGSVTVGERTHIGCGSTIIQGIKIGAGCTIGAGSLVLKDIPDGTLAFGVPAKVQKKS